MAGTIRQIAELAGVSRGTVDRALNHRGRIDPKVAEKIWQIAEELDYRPGQRKGRRPAVKGIKIGVVTQMSSSSFMEEIHRGIEEARLELVERGVSLLVRNIPSQSYLDQVRAIDELTAEGVQGLALMPVDCDEIRSRINRLMEKHIQVVTFNSDIVGTRRCCYVGLDNQKSGRTAAGLLGMLTGGQGKVLVVTGSFTNSVHNLRVEGFVEEIKRSFSEMELLGVQSSSGDEYEVEQILCSTLEREPDLAALFLASRGQKGLVAAFEKMGLKKRPYVVAYDLTRENVACLREGRFDFLIDQEGYVQGYRAIRVLYDLLVKEKKPDTEQIFTDIRIMTRFNL